MSRPLPRHFFLSNDSISILNAAAVDSRRPTVWRCPIHALLTHTGSTPIHEVAVLLPAASQGAVQLHDREGLVFLGDGQIELRGVVVSVVGKHFKVTGRAAVVAESCQSRRILRRRS